MPYDASSETEKDWANRRGPLRPNVLASARSRMRGDTVARLVQLTDVLLLLGLFVAGRLNHDSAASLGFTAAASFIVVAALNLFEAYLFSAREKTLKHLSRVVGAVGGSALVMLAFASFGAPAVKAANVTLLVDWCLMATALVGASHLAWMAYIRRLRGQGLLTPNILIVGATPAAERLVSAALSNQEVNVLGIFDDRGDSRRPRHIFGVPVLGRTKEVKIHRLLPFVDRIVIAVPPGATARIAQLISEMNTVPNAISLLVEGRDPASERASHERILDMPLAHLSGARQGALQAILKRMIDVSFSAMGIVVLAPALVAIAVAIRLDSPGPVLFKQRRHGYMNEEVLVWKFRSMRVEMTDYAAARQVTAGDDRVTRVGRFIRRTSLDELPQLWNVIRGEMSLVGPRPHAIGMLAGGAEASKLVETYAHRHRMKPGLTGWAAVNGSRGPADSAEAIRRRVALDLEYVERQSVWLDLAIIARTLPCVLGDSQSVR